MSSFPFLEFLVLGFWGPSSLDGKSSLFFFFAFLAFDLETGFSFSSLSEGKSSLPFFFVFLAFALGATCSFSSSLDGKSSFFLLPFFFGPILIVYNHKQVLNYFVTMSCL
uniref:Uncharacterized protein n=1 Tax=Cacopsylla melanoneura TaxID=428564 RepID=A0A8D8UVG5_9HEMI